VEAEAVEAVKFLWKRKHFEVRKLETEANSEAFVFFEEPEAEAFFIKQGASSL